MTFLAEESINESNDLNIVHFSRCIKNLFMFEKNFYWKIVIILCIGCYNHVSKKTGDKKIPENKHTCVSDQLKDALL